MGSFLAPFAAPLAAAWIAPGPQELQSETAEMNARLERAEVIQVALGRVHRAWGEAATLAPVRPCEDPLASSWVARSRALGAAYRDSVQSSRAQLGRLEYLWASETVQPLLDADERAAADHFRGEVARHVRAWSEAAAWQALEIEPSARKCQHELVPTEGLPYTGALSASVSRGVGILGVGGGKLCPMDVPADGFVVAPDGVACWGADTCLCTPIEVLPAAVLGPP